MILIWELDSVYGTIWRFRVDEHMAAALNKLLPLEVGHDLLPLAYHVRIDELGLLGLTGHKLVEKDHCLLDDLNYMAFELYKVILYRDEIILMVVLLEDLLV